MLPLFVVHTVAYLSSPTLEPRVPIYQACPESEPNSLPGMWPFVPGWTSSGFRSMRCFWGGVSFQRGFRRVWLFCCFGGVRADAMSLTLWARLLSSMLMARNSAAAQTACPAMPGRFSVVEGCSVLENSLLVFQAAVNPQKLLLIKSSLLWHPILLMTKQ